MASGLLQIGRKLEKWQWRHKFQTWRHCQFFDIFWFLLSSLVTGPSFMSVSSLVLESWQFLFIRDWPEIRKSEIPPSEFCSISGDWEKQGILNLARTSLIKCYWMLQNERVITFTVSELLRENPSTQIRVKRPSFTTSHNQGCFAKRSNCNNKNP